MFAAFAVFGGRVMGDNGITVTPFLDILAQDKHPLTNHLIAQQQSIVTEILADKR